MSTFVKPIQLLEINVISAQDLARVSRNMQTYAIAWVNHHRKLSTRVDTSGRENPNWNDKFVFRVDDGFLQGETSAVMIEIYAKKHWRKDILVGTVRVIVGNLIPPQHTLLHNQHHVQLGTRFVALQVRRRSGRPQGILNIGAALLDSSKRSMPLYNQFNGSAVGYKQLMGVEEDSFVNNRKVDERTGENSMNPVLVPWAPKPELRRIKSTGTSMAGSSMLTVEKVQKNGRASSIINGSEMEPKVPDHKMNLNTKSKASSMISMTPGSSFVGGLVKTKYNFADVKGSAVNGSVKRRKVSGPGGEAPADFDPGPSASEVAAQMYYKSRFNRPVEDDESEIMGEWDDYDYDMEGLQTKLQRWRAELPPIYDIRGNPNMGGRIPSYTPSRKQKNTSSSKGRRYNRNDGYDEDDDGGFSCFSKICGLECAISCGGGSGRRKSPNRGRQIKRSISSSSSSYL